MSGRTQDSIDRYCEEQAPNSEQRHASRNQPRSQSNRFAKRKRKVTLGINGRNRSRSTEWSMRRGESTS